MQFLRLQRLWAFVPSLAATTARLSSGHLGLMVLRIVEMTCDFRGRDGWRGCGHEVEELDPPAPPFVNPPPILCRSHIEGREQRGGSRVRLYRGVGPSARSHWQASESPGGVPRLIEAFLDRKNSAFSGGSRESPTTSAALRRKIGIVAFAPAFCGPPRESMF